MRGVDDPFRLQGQFLLRTIKHLNRCKSGVMSLELMFTDSLPPRIGKPCAVYPHKFRSPSFWLFHCIPFFPHSANTKTQSARLQWSLIASSNRNKWCKEFADNDSCCHSRNLKTKLYTFWCVWISRFCGSYSCREMIHVDCCAVAFHVLKQLYRWALRWMEFVM